MGDPPSDSGAVHDTVADPSPGVAVTPVGAPGAVGAASANAIDGGIAKPNTRVNARAFDNKLRPSFMANRPPFGPMSTGP